MEQTKNEQNNTVDSSLLHTVRINPVQLSFQTSEAIKMLRANIQFSGYGLRAISLTSCNAGEGKSFVSFELAKSLAELGKRTLFWTAISEIPRYRRDSGSGAVRRD